MAQIQLAEALLRRKELQEKVDQLRPLKEHEIMRSVVRRIKVTDNLDEVQAAVPIVTIGQVKAAYDWHARQLRLVDAAIQRANWETGIEVPDSVMADFKEDPSEVKDTRFDYDSRER